MRTGKDSEFVSIFIFIQTNGTYIILISYNRSINKICRKGFQLFRCFKFVFPQLFICSVVLGKLLFLCYPVFFCILPRLLGSLNCHFNCFIVEFITFIIIVLLIHSSFGVYKFLKDMTVLNIVLSVNRGFNTLVTVTVFSEVFFHYINVR